MDYKINKAILQALIVYLNEKPHKEVFRLITLLNSLPEIEEVKKEVEAKEAEASESNKLLNKKDERENDDSNPS